MRYSKEANALRDSLLSTGSTRGQLTRIRRALELAHVAGASAAGEEMEATYKEANRVRDLLVESNNKLITKTDQFDKLREQYQSLNKGSTQQVQRINELNDKVRRQDADIRNRDNRIDGLCTEITELRETNCDLGRQLLSGEANTEMTEHVPALTDTSVELDTWRLVGENLMADHDTPAFGLALAMAERLLVDAQ